VYRPAVILAQASLKFNLTNKIGGMFGLGMTSCHSQIIFERNEYYLGDKAVVKIICDNSKCSKAVRCFKIKLHRIHKAKDIKRNESKHGEYCKVLKAEGCPANTKVERLYTL
jgi:hypothetical protein